MLLCFAMLDSDDERNKFVRLYNQYRYFMWYIAKGVLGDEYLAEDAVHEAFLTVTHYINKINEEEVGRTKSFLAAVVKSRAIDILRKKNRTEIISIDEVGDYLSDNDDILEEYISEENYQALLKCISKLDDTYREVFELKYLHGLSDSEAGEILGISAKNVNIRMYRARKKLQEMLKKEADYVS